MVYWVPTTTHGIIHYNCEHFITKAEKPHVPAVNRHVIHQSAPKSAVEFGNRRVHSPDGFYEIPDLNLSGFLAGNLENANYK